MYYKNNSEVREVNNFFVLKTSVLRIVRNVLIGLAVLLIFPKRFCRRKNYCQLGFIQFSEKGFHQQNKGGISAYSLFENARGSVRREIKLDLMVIKLSRILVVLSIEI